MCVCVMGGGGKLGVLVSYTIEGREEWRRFGSECYRAQSQFVSETFEYKLGPSSILGLN